MDSAPFIDKGLFFTVGEVRYVAWPSANDLKITSEPKEHTFVTVIPVDSETVGAVWLQEHIDRYTKNDDVFKLEFLAGYVPFGAICFGVCSIDSGSVLFSIL